MIVRPQKVEVRWNTRIVKHYTDLGYTFTKVGDSFLVDVDEIGKGSRLKIECKCEQCSQYFYRNAKNVFNSKIHFCNNKCKNKYLQMHPLNPSTQVECKCDNCEESFKVKKYYYDNYKSGKMKNIFCSRKCQGQWNSRHNKGENNPNYKGKITKICKYCGCEFDIIPCRKERNKYCSKTCMMDSMNRHRPITKMRKVKCASCQKEVERWQHEIEKYDNNFCSKQCHLEYQAKLMRTDEYRKNMSEKKSKWLSENQNTHMTKPQIIINDLLDSRDISYENEKSFKYYNVDNYLCESELIIEVMGDYWHANPKVFSKNKINKMQRKNINKDRTKRTFIHRYYDTKILYLWETDINKNISLCEKLINHYIDNNGILEDYQSFNYELDEYNNLILKDEIISPYFLNKDLIEKK